MPEKEPSDAYCALIKRTGLDPELTREVELRTAEMLQHGPGICLRVRDTADIPGHGRARYRSERRQGAPLLVLPDGVWISGDWLAPKHHPELAPAPATPSEYWRRVDALGAAVAGLGGRLCIWPEVECGWLPLVEKMTAAILMAMGPEDRVEVDANSTHGNLSVTVSVTVQCSDETAAKYIADVGAWAEAATQRRCQVYGTTGWTGPLQAEGDGWIYTLSDQARALPVGEIGPLIYPQRPQGVPR